MTGAAAIGFFYLSYEEALFCMCRDRAGSFRYNSFCISDSRRSIDIPFKGPFDELLSWFIGSLANAQPAA